MPQTSILAQVAPAATTETTLYQVPADKYCLLTSLSIANRGAGTVSFRLSISKAGAATATKDYRYYDKDILTKDSFIDDFSVNQLKGLRIESLDIIRIYASTNELSFNLFGTEVG